MPTPVHTLDGIEIPAGIVWKDEFGWGAASATVTPGLTGAPIVQVGIWQCARPCTLESIADDQGWIRRPALIALRALADTGRTDIVLNHADGRVFRVMFAPGEPIRSRPIAWREIEPTDWPHTVTLKLLILEDLT